jgi:cytidylate kinase
MTKKEQKYIIAIDGGVATGKSTIAKAVAKELNFVYINTGDMYRAVTLYFVQNNIEITDENIVSNINDIKITFRLENNNVITILNGEDVTEKLHSANISKLVPLVAKVKIVREKMVELQREFAKNNSIVMDGRDIASVVFPNATLKIFLTASLDERARRRKLDLEKRGEYIDIDILKNDILKRDKIDMEREESPLIKVEDAVVIDTTGHNISDDVNTITELLKRRTEI